MLKTNKQEIYHKNRTSLWKAQLCWNKEKEKVEKSYLDKG